MEVTERSAPLDLLNSTIDSIWQEILTQPKAMTFLESLASGDRRIYAIYLIQVYHYTWHTSRNQALVGVNPMNNDIQYMRYCFEHALEEVGHELMALHDLKSMGVQVSDPQKELPSPLPATEMLVAYLYWISQRGNPVQRLGYSYWAEKSYDYIRPFVENMAGKMGLKSSQMTFFYNHSTIDEKHAREVEEMVLRVCRTEADWEAVRRVAQLTLKLTSDILNSVVEEYERLVEGESEKFAFLNSLKSDK